MRLARFSRESKGVFTESQLVKVFLSKIEKCLLDLTLPRIIMEFGGHTTLAEAFAIVKQCDDTLCQYDATDLVSLLVDSSKSGKALVATVRLAEVEADKTLYYWSCGELGHAKKDCPFKQKKAPTAERPRRKTIFPAKDPTKDTAKHLLKQLACFHCGKPNHTKDHCFILHPEKQPLSAWEKAMEAKLGDLEEKFKSLASSGQILTSSAPSGAKASSSTPHYYMLGAFGEVVSIGGGGELCCCDTCSICVTSHTSNYTGFCGEFESSGQ